MINKYNDSNEEALEEMLSVYIQIGKIDEARGYLKQVKHTFSKYDEWNKILNVHNDFKDLGYKVNKLKFHES